MGFSLGSLVGGASGAGPGVGSLVGGSDSGIGGALQGVMGMLGIGPDSAAAQAADAAAQNQLNAEITQAEENIRSKTNLMEQEQENRQAEGTQRADIGASGVSMATGSPLDAEASLYMQDQFKAQVAIFNGQVNLAQDEAQATASAMQSLTAEAGATSSSFATDAGLVASLFKL